MIDVYAPADLLPSSVDEQLGSQLTHAVLRAEGVATPGAFHLDNTAAFIHRLPNSAISTAASSEARVVRVQVVTPPGALTRAGQRQLTEEATKIVADLAGDPTQGSRTWVILTEAAEGGWGIAGTAFGLEEFGALARAAAAAKSAE
jgi:phenylpyruvate tautomerase PptA (4-oxalocrotonate tautomerase family)